MSLTKNIKIRTSEEIVDIWDEGSWENVEFDNTKWVEQKKLIEEINKIPNELSEYEDIISRKEVIKLIKGEG